MAVFWDSTDKISDHRVGTDEADSFVARNFDVFSTSGPSAFYRTYDGGAGSDTLELQHANMIGAMIDLEAGYGTAAIYTDVLGGFNPYIPVNYYLSNIENIIGSERGDWLAGNAAANLLYGNLGEDTLFGRAGNDSLFGEDQNDHLYGDAGLDTLDGGSGNDDLHGGLDADTLYGGLDHDMLYGDEGDDTLYGQDGDDRLEGGLGNDLLIGGAGTDVLIGDTGTAFGSDFLDGGAGSDFLYGGAGMDFLYGGAGADTNDGGANYDTVDFGTSTSVTVDLMNAANSTGDAAGDVFISVEMFQLTAGADRFVGSNGSESVQGWSGADTLIGNGGMDFLYGGADADTLDGGAGGDVLDGGDGVDTASYASATAGVYIDLTRTATNTGDAAGDTYRGIETFRLSRFDDRVIGLETTDTVYGGDGRDNIAGRGGDDWIFGETGNDVLYGGLGNDRINGGAGSDFVFGDAGNDTLTGDGAGVSSVRDYFMYGARGFGNDTIVDFADTVDLIDMRGMASAGVHSMADLTITQGFIGRSFLPATTISLGTDSITLNYVTAGQITASDFLFA